MTRGLEGSKRGREGGRERDEELGQIGLVFGDER
jgi:hypothetical protein